jgi:hypothetical protein
VIIDIRYHVASLVAVFLALGLGIFIGSTIVGESLVAEIVEQQESMVSKLEGDYEALKNEAKKYQEQLTAIQETAQLYKRYAEESIPYVLKDKLPAKRIAIIQNGDLEIPQQFFYNLKIAGAEIISYTKFSPDLYADSERIDDLVCALGGTGDRVDCVLITHGYLNPAGINLTLAQRIEEILLQKLQGQGIPVYVVKGSTGYPVNDRLYKEFTVSTVDDINTVPGQIALILAMAGYHGHYEIKATADFLLPAFNQ